MHLLQGDGATLKDNDPYDEKYVGQEYYWGKKPSALCGKVIKIMQPTSNFHPKLLDLGCGEGRNAVYFAKNGFDVNGLDMSGIGLEKMRRYAKETGVCIKEIQTDITDYQLTDTYDVIFSTGTLHYLPPETRKSHFQNYKDHTASDGINAFSVLIAKPFIPRAPDADETVHLYKPGELVSYYWDWEILHCKEEIFNCTSSGVPHKHAVNRIIARRHRNDNDIIQTETLKRR